MNRSLLALAFLFPAALGPVACNSATVCAEEPVCEEGETQVDACDGTPDCREVEACGVTIGCVPGGQCEGMPSCTDGFREVDACPAGVTCETPSMCGTTILCAPNACDAADDCLATEFCDFPDDLCGQGEAGSCTPRPEFCTDGPRTCLCDGTTTDLPCPGMTGVDFDASGACAEPPGEFACGVYVCTTGAHFCQLTTDDTGGPPYADCRELPLDCSDCSCLTTETAACNGTCVDGDFPTITCPGG